MSSLIIWLLNFAVIILFIRAILSWVRPQPGSGLYSFVDLIDRITEPVLGPIRRALPAMGGIDFSPVIVIFAIRLLLIPLVRSTLG